MCMRISVCCSGCFLLVLCHLWAAGSQQDVCIPVWVTLIVLIASSSVKAGKAAIYAQGRLQSRSFLRRLLCFWVGFFFFWEGFSGFGWGFFYYWLVCLFVLMWNTLSWRGAAAAAVSEEPVNYFSQVTSCYPKVQGQLGGGRGCQCPPLSLPEHMQLQLVCANETQKLLCRHCWSPWVVVGLRGSPCTRDPCLPGRPG